AVLCVLAIELVSRDGVYGSAGERSLEIQLLLRGQLAQNAISLARNPHWHLSWHGRGGRTRTRGIREHVPVRKCQFFYEAAGFFKFTVGLAGKSDHYIGADRRARHSCADLLDLFAVMPWTILAVHSAQHAVAAGLQGEVGVLGKS